MKDVQTMEFDNIDRDKLGHYLKVYKDFWLTIPGSGRLIIRTTKTQIKNIIYEQPDDCITEVALKDWDFIVVQTIKIQSNISNGSQS
jgi:hypothetical protein